MSEYRKPFEYEEEKGMPAFLLVFLIMLLTTELLLGASLVIQGGRAFKDTPALSATVLVVGSAYLLLIFTASIALRKSFRLGVTLSKILLIARMLVLVPVYIVLFVSLSRLPTGSAEPILITRLIAPIGYIALFSAGWYAYLLKSKKVRQLQETPRKKS